MTNLQITAFPKRYLVPVSAAEQLLGTEVCREITDRARYLATTQSEVQRARGEACQEGEAFECWYCWVLHDRLVDKATAEGPDFLRAYAQE